MTDPYPFGFFIKKITLLVLNFKGLCDILLLVFVSISHCLVPIAVGAIFCLFFTFYQFFTIEYKWCHHFFYKSNSCFFFV
nr:MAG TPA: hypothetical protein [Caudoviricetes sp.]